MSATPPPIDLTSLDKATRALHGWVGAGSALAL